MIGMCHMFCLGTFFPENMQSKDKRQGAREREIERKSRPLECRR